MPSATRRQVGFNPTPVYSRLPRDDETYVMQAFARHAAHCSTCANPYEVHCAGGTLCAKGHQLALDVAQYVYNKGGKAYSLVDREGSNRVQIEIPVGCEAVRLLLRAMERGLRLMRTGSSRTEHSTPPVVSYDRTYYVPSRRASAATTTAPAATPAATEYEIKPRLETARPARGRWERPSTRRGSSKGSLYESDMKERERYFSAKPTVYYGYAERAPPVPAKDYPYWR